MLLVHTPLFWRRRGATKNWARIQPIRSASFVRPSVRPTLRRYSLYGKCSELGCDDYDAYLLRCRIFLNVRSLFVRCQWPFLPPHALPSTVPLALVGYGFRVVYLLPYVSYQPHFPVNDIWGI